MSPRHPRLEGRCLRTLVLALGTAFAVQQTVALGETIEPSLTATLRYRPSAGPASGGLTRPTFARIEVTNCDDDRPDSLRAAVTEANDIGLAGSATPSLGHRCANLTRVRSHDLQLLGVAAGDDASNHRRFRRAYGSQPQENIRQFSQFGVSAKKGIATRTSAGL